MIALDNAAEIFDPVAGERGGEEEEEGFLRVKTSFLITWGPPLRAVSGPTFLSLVTALAAALADAAGVEETAATTTGGGRALAALFCPTPRLAAEPGVRMR